MRCVNLPKELETGFAWVNRLLPDTDDVTVAFEAAPAMTLTLREGVVVIGYSRKCEAFRGMSMAKRFLKDPTPICHRAKFDSLSVMVDCSRDSVLKPESVKELMVTLAMFGFNAMMLYTEDTYEVPGHPYFGHMRGRYTREELKALDAFGKEMGIELIPCIQTLAHLNAIFNWPAYFDVRDIDDILIAEDEKTLALIDAMLKTCRECFSSDRINIGMDEAHNLGRGKYLERNGYHAKSDIMLRHLDQVVSLCKKYNYTPIMWSDMFFRMQFNGDYFVTEGELSQEVLDKIPEGVAMCYWDYYTPPCRSQRLEHMFSQHARMNRPIWFAGGSWSWRGPVPKNYFSNHVTPNQLAYAEKYGVQNVIATVWGDDGGECTVWNMLPSLLQYGQLNYGDASPETLEARSLECLGLGYADLLLLDAVGKPAQPDETRTGPTCVEKIALYNDPMMGMFDAQMSEQLAESFGAAAAAIMAVPNSRFGYLFKTQFMLGRLLRAKTMLSAHIKAAYRSGDKEALQQIISREIPVVMERMDNYHDALSAQWHKVNKPFGFEIQDLRQGGLRQRLFTASQRLRGYLDGSIDRLEELEQPDLTYFADRPIEDLNSWRKVATAGVVAFN